MKRDRRSIVLLVVSVFFLAGLMIYGINFALSSFFSYSNDLPSEAWAKIEESFVGRDMEITLVSARRATTQSSRADEVWCVKTRNSRPGFINHFLAERSALLWRAYPVEREDGFLIRGCNNY